DFARVLIATPDLEIVNTVETVLDENDSEASQSDYDEGHGDLEVRQNVDTLVEKLADGLEEEDDKESQEKYQYSNYRVD
ncbi:hypothetical protein A2U01_0068863, partial [Trifolium medium]|nr:hypothetical protein [Trifolium medium]